MKKVIMICVDTNARYMVEVESTVVGCILKNVKNSLMLKIAKVEGANVFVKSYSGKRAPKGVYRIEKKTSGLYFSQKLRAADEAAWVGVKLCDVCGCSGSFYGVDTTCNACIEKSIKECKKWEKTAEAWEFI